MKKLYLYIFSAIISVGIAFNACEKTEFSNNTETELPKIFERKSGNGKGNKPSDSAYVDTLNRYCGITLTDTAQTFPSITLTNIVTRHATTYNFDPATGAYSYPVDNLIITFDAPVISGKVVNCYMLFADQCQGRPVCTKMNGITASQVTACGTTTRMCITLGATWLNPNVQSYTGFISVGTTEGCTFLSQPFTFSPPRIL